MLKANPPKSTTNREWPPASAATLKSPEINFTPTRSASAASRARTATAPGTGRGTRGEGSRARVTPTRPTTRK